MLSSQLNKRITIEKGTIGVNAVGSPSLSWTAYSTIWAKVYVSSGDTKMEVDGELLTYRTEFTIRYNNSTKQINNKYRVNYNNEIYKIMQIQEIGIKEGFKLVCLITDDDGYPEV
jgi:SPP1 family predicted phage head-tail adaptor